MGYCVRWGACKPHSRPLRIICQALSVSICGRKKNRKNLSFACFPRLFPENSKVHQNSTPNVSLSERIPTQNSFWFRIRTLNMQIPPCLRVYRLQKGSISHPKWLFSSLNPTKLSEKWFFDGVIRVLIDFSLLGGFQVGNLLSGLYNRVSPYQKVFQPRALQEDNYSQYINNCLKTPFL